MAWPARGEQQSTGGRGAQGAPAGCSPAPSMWLTGTTHAYPASPPHLAHVGRQPVVQGFGVHNGVSHNVRSADGAPAGTLVCLRRGQGSGAGHGRRARRPAHLSCPAPPPWSRHCSTRQRKHAHAQEDKHRGKRTRSAHRMASTTARRPWSRASRYGRCASTRLEQLRCSSCGGTGGWGAGRGRGRRVGRGREGERRAARAAGTAGMQCLPCHACTPGPTPTRAPHPCTPPHLDGCVVIQLLQLTQAPEHHLQCRVQCRAGSGEKRACLVRGARPRQAW